MDGVRFFGVAERDVEASRAGECSVILLDSRTAAGIVPGDGLFLCAAPGASVFAFCRVTGIEPCGDPAFARECCPEACTHLYPDTHDCTAVFYYPEEDVTDRRGRVLFTARSTAGYSVFIRARFRPDCRRVVIVTHGMFGTMDSRAADELCDAMPDVTVLAWDLPAHGMSAVGGEELTLRHCLADLDTVVSLAGELFPTAAVSLFGTSLGSYLSLLYCTDHPGAIESIAARCTAVRMDKILYEGLLTERERQAFDRDGGIEVGFDRRIVLYHGFLDELRERILPEQFDAGMTRVLLIHGTADTVAPIRDSRSLANRHRLHFLEIPGAGHRFEKKGELQAVIAAAVPHLCAEAEK